jgi:plastocyanin
MTEKQPVTPARSYVAFTVLALLMSGALHAATHQVGIYDYYFSPQPLVISAGDTVTWHNYGTNAHSSTSRAPTPVWDSGVLNTNQDYSFTFISLGPFPYYDKLYPGMDMKGNITVTTNQSPAVSITNPVPGASFTAPTNLLIQATASDSGGTVAQVEFFANNSSLGVVTNAPFGIVASNLTAGTYVLSAVATDDGMASTTSSNVTITVKPVLKNPARPASNRFQVTLTGATPSKSTILYASTDLLNWTPIQTNLLSTTTTNLIDPAATNRWRFYRTGQLP